MKKQLFRLSGTMMAALLVAGCASDPLDDQRNIVTSVSTSLSYAELLVGDSTEATAQSRDALGNALAALPDVSSANTAVVSITNNPRSGAPEPTRIFQIVANGFGITTVTASSGSSKADITVQTFPASVDVTGIAAGTQIGSGSTVQLTATALGTDGTPVAGGPSITWATGDATIATVDASGLVTTASPGLAVVTATTDGGAEGLASFEVIPGAFPGTPSSATGTVDQLITFSVPAGSPAFDATTVFTIGGVTASIVSFTATTAVVAMPSSLAPGTVTVLITGLGATEITQSTTFDIVAPSAFGGGVSAATADPFDQITITPGGVAWDGGELFFVGGIVAWVVSQDATSAVLLVPSSATGAQEILIRKQGAEDIAGTGSIDMQSVFTPNGNISPVVDLLGGPFPMQVFTQLSASDPDDFFGLDNSGGGAAVDLSVTLQWQTSADLDILQVDCPFNFFVGNFDGAGSANPEATSFSVPAGECWLLWFNLFAGSTSIAKWNITSP